MEPAIPGLDLGEPLREDAFGVWYRAARDGAPRTLRILREELQDREDARLLFTEEMRRIVGIDHPALLRVHESGARASRPWVLTDPIDGPTLETEVAGGRALELDAAVGLVRSVASALAYLQERRQVHVAPIPARLVRVDSSWRLLTFRDVRAWDELKQLKGRKHANPAFAPPEWARGHPEPLRPHPFGAFCLGALLRFAAGGGAPGQDDGTARPLPDSLPEPLAAMVRRLSAERPQDRPQGHPAVQAVLDGATEAASGPTSGSAPAPAAPIRAPVPRKRRGRR